MEWVRFADFYICTKGIMFSFSTTLGLNLLFWYILVCLIHFPKLIYNPNFNLGKISSQLADVLQTPLHVHYIP